MIHNSSSLSSKTIFIFFRKKSTQSRTYTSLKAELIPLPITFTNPFGSLFFSKFSISSFISNKCKKPLSQVAINFSLFLEKFKQKIKAGLTPLLNVHNFSPFGKEKTRKNRLLIDLLRNLNSFLKFDFYELLFVPLFLFGSLHRIR